MSELSIEACDGSLRRYIAMGGLKNTVPVQVDSKSLHAFCETLHAAGFCITFKDGTYKVTK